uniref:Actin-related protein 2/3 complex subunit 5 n=1 Tax=Syphacia muris TaxID=451379 RepID=A0A0N5AVD0_9BILA
MAKNVENTDYRKLDVDAYDPENFEEAEEAETAAEGPDEKQINQFIQNAKLLDALKAALVNPPLKTKNQAVKDRATTLVTKVLTNFKNAEMEAAVKSLTDDEVDLLMKYVYKAMDIQAESATCPFLLSWHAQLVARGGHGCIVRTLCDRHRL